MIEHVKYGKNKDGDKLPQVNLVMVFGEKSMLPVYFRKLPGNITDVKTVEKLLKDLSFLNINKIKLVMDRGFFSFGNIDKLLEQKYKFIIGIKNNVKFVSENIDQFRIMKKNHSNYSSAHDVYYNSNVIDWKQMRLNYAIGKTSKSLHNIFLHVYYNPQKAETEKSQFLKSIEEAIDAVFDNTASEKQQKLVNKYFIAKGHANKSITYIYNDEKIQKYLDDCGYFALLTDTVKDPAIALSVYRNKDVVEKAFYNIKNRLNPNKTAVSSSDNLDGKLFIEFVALIIISFIHKKMKDNNLYSKYTMESCLDELDLIERFDYPDKDTHYAEQTQKQIELFEIFEVDLLV
jgi:transposase